MVETNTLLPSSKTGGLLLSAFRAGKTEEITWTEVTLGDLVLTVAQDAMKAAVGDRTGVRLPVSYAETVTICRELGCIAPTQAMADAMFAQARSKTSFVGLVQTAADSAKMATVAFTLRFNDGVEKQLQKVAQSDRGLICGAWKFWLLHPRLSERGDRGAVNYGFWDLSKKPPKTIQTPGGAHDSAHYDYSQLLQPIKRMARKASTGEEVDLLDHIAKTDKVAARYLEVYKPEVSTIQSFGPEDIYSEVDIVETLTAAGVDVVAAPGWKERGKPGFTPEGIMVHHTAVASKADAPTLNTCINGRTDPKNPKNNLSGPLCHILLARSGKAHVIAANLANHAGTGAQQVLDLVRKDEPVVGNAGKNGYKDALVGNPYFYGIEVENAGTAADPYPQAQIDALAKICAALCSAHGWSAGRVIHHRQWTSRKIDMSYGGDLPSMVAQMMDSGATPFGVSFLEPDEVEYEPEGAEPEVPVTEPVAEEVKQATPKKAAPKKAAPKKTAPEQAAPKKAAPKKTAPEQAAPKKAAPKKAAPKKAAPKKTAPEQAAPKKAAPKKAAPKKTAPKKAAPKKAAPEPAAPTKAAPKKAAPKKAAPEKAAPTKAAPKKAAPKKAAKKKTGTK